MTEADQDGPKGPGDLDGTWNAYMGRRRDWTELAALVEDNGVRPEHRQRAMQVLGAPDIHTLPFHVTVNTDPSDYASVRRHWLGSIVTEAQAGLVADPIPGYIQEAKQVIQRDERKALSIYNGLIPELLGKLSPEQAERLFESFSIIDYWNLHSASEYHPLRSLYHNRAVNESWKRKAASQMHAVIEREQSVGTTARLEHEAAVVKYGIVLGLMLYDKEGLPISRGFYQEEIAFMLGVETGKPVIDLWCIGQVLDLLDNAELRHSFARRQLLIGEQDSSDRFKVSDEAHAQTARRIMEEFPDDKEITAYLEQELQSWQIISEKTAEKADKARKTEEEILAEMRTPLVLPEDL